MFFRITPEEKESLANYMYVVGTARAIEHTEGNWN